MKRREFIAGLGGAAAWPLAAGAQQRNRMPVVGILDSNQTGTSYRWLAAFRQGLAEAGFVDGKNVSIEYRGANLQFSRLRDLAADLVHRQVDVIFTADSIESARAAKSATTTIPIVFYYGGDPVGDALVTNLSQPGANLTGVTSLQTELTNKRLGLLHELVPVATTLALVTGPTQPPPNHSALAGARTLGLDIVVFRIRSNSDLDRAFETFTNGLVGAVIIDNDSYLDFFAIRIPALAERYKIPTIYPGSTFVRAGGLISYGADRLANYRQAAAQYIGPILKGAKPADLPVQQPVKFELVINMKAAKALNLAIPPTLLAIADEVIEVDPSNPSAAAVSYGRLGVQFRLVTGDIAGDLKLTAARGVVVTAVDDTGAAKPAGIQVGDVIVRMDGKEISDLQSLPRIVAETPTNKRVEVIILRGGEERTIFLTLGRPY